VVVMPGVYTEPTSRAAPTNDPSCDQYEVANDEGQTGAVSYAYQVNCPNDQNLIAVLGRALGPGQDPSPPLMDRRGIPNLGPCIRCNFQIEGSGVGADDVVIDAGRVESGNQGPAESVKDVVIRADRADGFVLRNMTLRHAREHGIYVLESDGYLLDRFKAFYNSEYGVLAFVEDHGVIQNCEAAGSGDSGLYPGASAETGAQRASGTPFRYNQQVRFCDAHHNAAGFSGTDSNAVWVHHNNFYDNALGYTTDVFTAAGHPGFPQDSNLVEDNNFFSNNFNPYEPGSDVIPTQPFPVGTGLWIAGGNDNIVRNNRFWDNWRRGTMLFAVPDVLVCGPVIGTPVTGCNPLVFSTSHRNRFHNNVMGQAPDGTIARNGLDFWWDSFPLNRGNCWYQNSGPAPITTSPDPLPSCANGKFPGLSVGTGNVPNELELIGCFGAISGGGFDSTTCPWFTTPPQPASSQAAATLREQQANQPEQISAEELAAVCRLYG
ncbi:MAG: right-handed parallel beta-helix repeat-containing protein, partial [Nocardioidaceae bacterium]